MDAAADGKRAAWRQLVVSKLRDKLREECLARGKEMRAAALASKRAGATAQTFPASTSAGPSHGPQGPPSGHGALPAGADVAQQVSHNVQAAVQTALQGLSSASHHSSTSQQHQPGIPNTPPSQTPSQHPPAPTTLPHPAIQTGGRPPSDPQSWLYDDDEFHREMCVAAASWGEEPGEWEAVAAQLYEALYDDVLSAQLEEIRREQEAGVIAGGGEGSGQGTGADGVLCPVCWSAHLVHVGGAVACPKEGWRLDLRTEGLSLDHLRNQLNQLYQAHAEQANRCPGPLVFSIQALAPGIQNLVAQCSGCGLLHVVL